MTARADRVNAGGRLPRGKSYPLTAGDKVLFEIGPVAAIPLAPSECPGRRLTPDARGRLLPGRGRLGPEVAVERLLDRTDRPQQVRRRAGEIQPEDVVVRDRLAVPVQADRPDRRFEREPGHRHAELLAVREVPTDADSKAERYSTHDAAGSGGVGWPYTIPAAASPKLEGTKAPSRPVITFPERLPP